MRVGTATLALEGIGSCVSASDRSLSLDATRPVIVLVHGWSAAQEDFRLLSEIFTLHDQQTVCYRYDDRERVTHSAARLRSALGLLATRLAQPEIVVIGHSQGGLVARTALSERDDAPPLHTGMYRLVTISAPFGGIGAARGCGYMAYHIASFGMSVAICRAVSGPKWNEIHAGSTLVRAPAPLSPRVLGHLSIVTDERDTCRRYAADGRRCLQDDFVFTLKEQRNPRIEQDRRFVQASISAGHVAVIGVGGNQPRKLLLALQHHGLLRETRAEEQIALERLTGKLGW